MENYQSSNKMAVISALLYDIWKLMALADKIEKNVSGNEASRVFFENIIKDRACIKDSAQQIADSLITESNPIFKVIKKSNQLTVDESKVADEFTAKAVMIPVLSMVELKTPVSIGGYYYPPKILDIRDIFPLHTSRANTDNFSKKYEDIYNNFISEIKSLPESDIDAFTDSLLYIYEKYLSYITTNFYTATPGISLYDHCRTVAALASCYADSAATTEKPFLIVSADISGIQSFIYSENKVDEGTRGASKRLRGKSFFVSLLTETFSSYLLRILNVSRCNLLINGGGHFILIAPNTYRNKELLQKAKNEIQLWFFRYFQGEINLIIEWLEADEDLYKNYSIWHDRISEKLQEGKKRKGSGVLEKIFADGFNDYNLDPLGNLTGEEKSELKASDYNLYERFMKGNDYVFEKLGRIIPYASHIVEIHHKNLNELKIKPYEDVLVKFSDWSIGWLLVKDEKNLTAFLTSNSGINSSFIRVMKLNDTSGLIPESLKANPSLVHNISFGFKFIGNAAPKENDTDGSNSGLLEFEELAGLNMVDEQQLDYRLLQILRMDVDNLGTIFSLGLKRRVDEYGIESLSRVVNLSRDLNLFFLGYLNEVAEKYGIYITYSGGDDLFTVGSWINTLDFALQVKKDFSHFACNNPNVTISGGIHTSKPSFPVGRSAVIAGKMESRAKNSKTKKPDGTSQDTKNKIAIYEIPLEWDDFEELMNYGKSLACLASEKEEGKGLKPSYIHFLLTQANEMFKRDSETGEVISDDLMLYYRKIALIKYSLARSTRGITAKKIEENNQKAEREKDKLILELAKLIFKPEKYLKNFVVPASYVIFKNRKPKAI